MGFVSMTPRGTTYALILAFNLCENLITDDEYYNENCIWIDHHILPLKSARFEFEDIMNPWNIKTTDFALSLQFSPRCQRAKKLVVAGGLIGSDFHQPLGLFNGSFRDGEGNTYPINDFFGIAEHHVTRY